MGANVETGRSEISELMNASFILAETAGANPLMFVLATWIVLAWRVAGYWGLDRWVLPAIGVPGTPGTLFRRRSSRDAGQPKA